MRSVYIINGNIVFFPRTHIISLIDGGSKVLLSIPASLCFRVLIENQGCIVSHSELLDRVWTERGINVNNNTLYQNIFLLRKALSSINENAKGIITTVSRRGFLIRADIKILYHQEYYIPEPKDSSDEFEYGENDDLESGSSLVKEEDKLADEISYRIKDLYPVGSSLKNESLVTKIRQMLNKSWLNKIIIFFCIILTVIFSFHLTVPAYNNIFELYKKIETNDQCEVLTNNNIDISIDNLLGILRNVGVSCSQKKYVYVSYNYPLERMSIIVCKNDNSNKFKHCYSYFYIR